MVKKEYWNTEIETKPLNDLKDLQLKRLKNLIDYVYKNNKFYHNKLKQLKILPSDIKSLNDIEKLPFLTKSDLREYYPFGLVCTEMDDIVEVHASSGTTGKPVVGPYTRNDVELEKLERLAQARASQIKSHGIEVFMAREGLEVQL